MGSRPRYVVRSMKVAAGSLLAAAAVSVLGVLGTAPAQAAVPQTFGAHAQLSAAAAGTLARRGIDAPEVQAGLLRSEPDAARERAGRIAGIRQEMQQAVSLGLVTQAQADRFTAQLAARIMQGR
ncbi:hypothetical protein LVY72_06195 [Arthrobacter sp. I2-34]|uniref:DUF4168 domain-containing protein n=1 Tax=Arthrobacter hankyongi TaxID=2904801 RepID=A0ABS9L497_9MICC|nr:hypothetical protein [Arthrobacter hankyongi]MCG2621507.1 hypothetical protein [Arthrobacter hankyongi]